MTFSSFFIEYTLITIFGGNKCAYAHAISLDEGSFRRAIRKASTGNDNSHLTNLTMELYVRAGVDAGSIFIAYRDAAKDEPGKIIECAYFYYVKRAHQKLLLYRALIEGREEYDFALLGISRMLDGLDASCSVELPYQRHICKFFHEMGQYDYLDERTLQKCPCKQVETLINSFCGVAQAE